MIPLGHDPPAVTLREAEAFVRKHFALELKASPLPGEWDRNFLLSGETGPVAVLKVSHAAQERLRLELENSVLDRLAERLEAVAFPKLVRTAAGAGVVELSDDEGRPHLARLLAWVPGTLYAHARPHGRKLLRSLGDALAHVDLALEGFSHPALRRPFKWDLDQALWIEEHLGLLSKGPRRALVEDVLADYRRRVVPAQPSLRRQAAYNDANDYNVLVRDGGVAGFVDLGDLVETSLVNDLAIACAYALMGHAAPLDAAREVVAAYHRVNPLLPEEIAILWTLIRARLAVSVVNSALQGVERPENAYLGISERPAWTLLERMAAVSPRRATYSLRAACGLPAHPDGPAIAQWLAAHTNDFAAVLPFDLRMEPFATLDLSVGSLDLGGGDRFPTERISALVAAKRAETAAAVLVGRYLEPRLLYGEAEFHDEGLERPERRTVHLGVDLFVEAGTPVRAPLEGRVVSVVDNAGAGNYGPTVILAHRAGPDGPAFHTLYGHLSPSCLEALVPGQSVAAGELLGAVGDTDRNGGWTPHLHLQVVLDLLDGTGDFPGVARPSDRDLYAGLCPDPGLLLGAPGRLSGEPEAIESILERRARSLGPSLSISYEKPLHVVRGFMQHLYDADGQPYLDMVNNVPHVGHSNPRVVAATARQMAVLSTNTRYLHPLLEEYAEALAATFPRPLSACFFVNSGSEANELALRLARVATGRKGTVVVDVGYHGNTTTLIDVSPYKHDGRGGRGAPDWVRKVALPDPYRGLFRGPASGPDYAALLDDALDALEAAGHPAGAFLVESMLGCGGQVVLPEGYLAGAFRRVRARGGLCIADEVQVGFGRAGTHFWAFEHQGVVPDVVTLGKPIGNGWPLGAVVTTPEIARAFHDGMEYFNTFGGSQASLAAGMAVLREVAEKDLQANALRVGARILTGLRELQGRHAALGDVRGLGLYIGAELVKDRETREPFPEAAGYVANRLRDLGVLVSTDGPDHNVLKVKPPLVVTEADADLLLEALDRILAEDAAGPDRPFVSPGTVSGRPGGRARPRTGRQGRPRSRRSRPEGR